VSRVTPRDEECPALAPAPALERLARAKAIVEQMDPYCGFEPERADH